MPSILLIGDDQFLLETRAAVLRPAGARIIQSDVAAAIPLLHKQCFDLVVLCHSIAPDACQVLTAIIQQDWPATRILLLSPVRPWEEADAPEGVDLCCPDPERLIARTIELLGRRRAESVSPVFHSVRANPFR